MLIFSIKSKTCHTNKQTFKTILFCSCLFSGRITTAINTANDYTDDVLQNGFGTNPVWLIREKVMSASRNNLPCFDWIRARDSLPDQVTCAHCGSTRNCLEGLRKHIIYGHCHQFDANRPWTRNGDEDIAEQLRLGRIDLLLTSSEVRHNIDLDPDVVNIPMFDLA